MTGAGPLDHVAQGVSRRPILAIVALLLVSVGLASFASRLEMETDFEAYAPGGGAAATLQDIRTEFGSSGAVVQVLVDAGSDGDVLTPAGLAATERVTSTIAERLGDRAASGEQAVQSFAGPIRSALEQAGAGGNPTASEVAAVATAALDSQAGAQLAGLFSSDLDVDAARARAGLVVVPLASDLSDDEAMQAAVDVRDAVDSLELEGFSTSVFGEPLLQRASAQLTQSELPRLLGLSLLLITVVLALVFRSATDVVIGLVGLAMTLAWTYGIGALLGPGWLGWTGPFNQITTVVPILVASLGIDFALHLTLRRREERADGGPSRAARVSIATVGGALALTTLTTAIGFLTNLASPLPPVQDFGVFAAVGVVSAFVVMLVLVPAAGELVGRRRNRSSAGERSGDDGGRPTPLPLIGSVARLSIGHPIAVVAVTLTVSGAAVVAAVNVPTTFDTDDFIPSGSRVAAAASEVENLFGADVSERTYVALEGPLQQLDVARAVADLPERLADVQGVRTSAGQPLLESPVTLVRELAASSPDFASRVEGLGWTDEGFADDADVAAIYSAAAEQAPFRASRVLEPDGDRQVVVVRTSAGQDGAATLADRLDEELQPVRRAGAETSIASQPLVFSRTVDALTSSQLRSIGITVAAAALLLVSYFWWRERSPALGLIAMVPTVLVATWVVGTMWLLGLSFNVLTITIGSLAIAIGVDYGIHIAYRFREELEDRPIAEAIEHTVEQTGGALAGSAATTAVGFGVLIVSSIVPIQQFGTITALTIVYSVVAAVLVMPAVLRLRWADGSS